MSARRTLSYAAVAVLSATLAVTVPMAYADLTGPETVSVPGELTLHERNLGTVDRSGDSCFGFDRFVDIAAGELMVLRSGTGEVLSRSYLGAGVWHTSQETPHPFDGDCVFPFTFVDVDLGDHEMFILTVGSRDRYGDGVPHTREEILTRGAWARIEGGL